jgi:protein-S-isoprenylcysteine O-methyltransferase Ste14
LRVLVLALAVLGVLLAVFATAIDAWRSLRGVPRAFGVTFVLLGLLLASLRVAAAFLSWAVALVSRPALG